MLVLRCSLWRKLVILGWVRLHRAYVCALLCRVLPIWFRLLQGLRAVSQHLKLDMVFFFFQSRNCCYGCCVTVDLTFFLNLVYCCDPITYVNLYSRTHATWALLAAELEWSDIGNSLEQTCSQYVLLTSKCNHNPEEHNSERPFETLFRPSITRDPCIY